MQQKENIVKAIQSDEEFVIATIVDTHGSAPGHVGFRMIVYHDTIEGTVGGGALEKEVMSQARVMLSQQKEAFLIRFNLSELGMTCGGQASVFLEPCFPKPSLWIFGAGHIARALTPLLVSIGFRVTVVDNREGFATGERFPANTVLMTKEYSEAIPEMPPGAYTVIVTHGHAHDEQILISLAAMHPPLPYIGMIGSKKKALAARKHLTDRGMSDAWNVYSPIGLKLGGDTPEEIALAIAAEVLGVHHHATDLPFCRLEHKT